MERRVLTLLCLLAFQAAADAKGAKPSFQVLHGKPTDPINTECGKGAFDPATTNKAGTLVWAEEGHHENDRWVGLFNHGSAAVKLDLRFTDIGLPDEDPGKLQYNVLDVSYHRNMPHPPGSFGVDLGPRSATLLYVQKDSSQSWPAEALGDRLAWVRPVGGGDACVGMFNMANRSLKFEFRFPDIGLPDEYPKKLEYSVLELLHVDTPRAIPHPPGSFGANLIDHAVALVKVQRTKVQARPQSSSLVEDQSQHKSQHALGLSNATISAVEVLQKNWFNGSTGLWDGAQWWNDANSVEALCNLIEHPDLKPSLKSQLKGAVARSFQQTTLAQTLTGRYDDEGWWALAWLRANDVIGGKQYVERAAAIFDDLANNAWDDTCGGGVWWAYYKQYKNAITNELFLEMALRLYNTTGNHSYHDWAVKAGHWLVASGMVNNQSLVNDGLTSDCKNNGQTEWTYNQGVILGGYVGLAQLVKSPVSETLMNDAIKIATATTKHLVNKHRILQESCDIDYSCDADQQQFKGVFLRYLGYIMPHLPASLTKAYLEKWVKLNTVSLLKKDRNSEGEFGLVWYGPQPSTGQSGPTIQTSALDALTAEDSIQTASKSVGAVFV